MADKQINQLVAASTMNDDDLLVMQQGGTAKKLSGKTLGDYVYAAAADKVAEVNQAVADAQAAVSQLEADKDSIAQTVASMAQLGTDTALNTTGMAADAKAAGDAISDLKESITDINADISVSSRLFNDQSVWGRYVVGTGGPNRIGTTVKSFDSSTTRISIYPIVDAHDIDQITITPDSGYKFYLFAFDQAVSSMTKDSGWQTEEKTFDISTDYYITIVLADTSNGTINVDSCDKLTVTFNKKVKDLVVEHEEEIETLSNKIDDLPSYWVDYFETKQTELTESDMDLGFGGVSFAFVTDVHINTNNKVSPSVIKYILTHTNIDTVICGGDIITDYNTKENAVEELQWWSENTKSLKVINLHGNHDGNSNNQTDQTQIISDAEFYGLMCRQSEGIVNWENGTLYGYKDNAEQNVRFIFLDTGAPDSAVISDSQITWMQKRVSELETGWTVVVFAHQFWTGTYTTTATLTIDDNGTKILNGLDSIYDSVNATIACVICGHCHRDYNMISEKGYPVIATTCDASWTNASNYDPDNPTRTAGTTTEQCFDLYYINTESRTINTIRIGAGNTDSNRSFTY